MSSIQYIQFPIDSNSQDLLDEMFAFLRTKAPAWVENDANLDTWLLQIMAAQSADLRRLATDVPDTIFRYFGANLLGVPPEDATQARTTSTWTVKDSAGYTIPDGTFVTIRDSAGNDVPFQTVGDVIIFAGSIATAADQVQLIATQPGAASSNLGSAGGVISPLTVLDFVSSITQGPITSGGVDAETSSAYNDRLVRRLRRLSTRPITPDDFSNAALEVTGIYRAIAIDLYDPITDTYGHDKTVTLAGLDITGADLSLSKQSELKAYIESNREVNFVCNIMNAKRTVIDVAFTGVAVQGYDPVVVHDDVIAALQAYLNPATWGTDPRFTTGAAAQTWAQINKVYYFEVAQVILNVPGLDRISTLTINKVGSAPGTADVAITTPASLAVAGTITGTVT